MVSQFEDAVSHEYHRIIFPSSILLLRGVQRHGDARLQRGFLDIGSEETRSRAFKEAKTRGWRIDSRGNRAWAPNHVMNRKTDKPAF